MGHVLDAGIRCFRPIKHIFKVGNFPKILTKYSSIEKHFVPYIDHSLDHFYDYTMDYLDRLSCQDWSSNKKVQQIEVENVHFENLS